MATIAQWAALENGLLALWLSALFSLWLVKGLSRWMMIFLLCSVLVGIVGFAAVDAHNDAAWPCEFDGVCN